jgi:cullin-associated NEDD8-dissociated protein 1
LNYKSIDDQSIAGLIEKSLPLLTDGELAVRKTSLTNFKALAHWRPKALVSFLPQYLSVVYEETKPRKELVRTVQMGPFQHVVDDGLETRKVLEIDF